jgi:hypothetical protein
MDKVEPLVEALDALTIDLMMHWVRSYWRVKSAHRATFLLANYQSWAEVFEVYDLKGFIQNLPVSSKRGAVLDAFEETVIAEVHGISRTETNGLSIFFPRDISPYGLVKEYKDAELHLDFPNDKWWNEFLFFFIATNLIFRG